MRGLRLSLLATALLATPLTHAAEMVMVNQDPPASGLNDTTAVAPSGGNPGLTIGEQRRIVYHFALDTLGALIQSPVPIRVQASFVPKQCSEDPQEPKKTILGSAGPWQFNRDFANAPRANTNYPIALANALAGVDLSADDDISSGFNSRYGLAGCSEGSGWYYGLDGRTPDAQTNFLNVVTHEITHGLGFSGDSSTARSANYAHRAYDRLVRAAGTGDWTALTNAQRQAARIGNRLVWTGANVNAEALLFLEVQPAFSVSAPAAAAAEYAYGTAEFGPAASAALFTGNIVRAVSTSVVNGANVDKFDACDPISNGAAVAGRIALVDRGTCNFSLKAYNVQQAGATAVIVANNKGGDPSTMSAGDRAADVTIPAIMVAQDAGASFVANAAGLTASGLAPFRDGRLAGLAADTDANGQPTQRVRLYSPDPFESGSSFSHFDVSASPNLLMEPSNTKSLIAQAFLDLTPAQMMDLGWTIRRDNLSLLDCATTVPMSQPGGSIPGANAVANLKMCARTSATAVDYRDCTGRYVQSRLEAKLFTPAQAISLKKCLVSSKADAQYAAWHEP